ncbi:hypothetical protein [Micromonospora lutea]|uniref:Uncharacterized protein n=1 Tax=Micromonospora lutea TaxID=419825 RepID=A0ABQ4J286_9ACTN|nr:hypothetical protein [Micromonospora lutea]GIJ24244.1 hypothetical protein Vlu01_48680 [Micromonospora lutea]
MTQLHIEGAALIAMLAAMPLISWGSTGGPDVATVVGAVLLAAGLITLTALRFVNLEGES